MSKQTTILRINENLAVARQMIDELPEELFSNPNTTFVDPAMGGGNYLRAALERCLKYHPREQILPRLTGVETSSLFINCATKYNQLSGANLLLQPLSETLQMPKQFDVFISNPPYQNGSNNKFYSKFMEAGLKLLKDGGYFSMLAPSKGALVGSKFARKFLEGLGWSKVELGMQKWFPNVGTTIALYTGVKGDQPDQLQVVLGDKSFVHDFSDPLPMTERPTADAVSIVQKFFAHDEKIPFIKVSEFDGEGDFAFVPRMCIRFTPHRPRGGNKCVDCGSNSWAKSIHKDGRIVLTEHGDELKTALQSDLYRYIWSQVLTGNYVPPFVWQSTPWLKGSLTSQALAIGLSKDELELVTQWAKDN